MCSGQMLTGALSGRRLRSTTRESEGSVKLKSAYLEAEGFGVDFIASCFILASAFIFKSSFIFIAAFIAAPCFIFVAAFIAASCFIFASLLVILFVVAGVGVAAMAGVAIAIVITVTMVVMRTTFMGISFRDGVEPRDYADPAIIATSKTFFGGCYFSPPLSTYRYGSGSAL